MHPFLNSLCFSAKQWLAFQDRRALRIRQDEGDTRICVSWDLAFVARVE